MNKKTGGKIAAVAAVAVLVALAAVWGALMRPSEPETVPHPTAAQIAAEDSALSAGKKVRKTRHDSTPPKKRHVPRQRDFLNEPVPSE